MIRHYPLVESRSTDFNFEIASDHPAIIESSVGRAYYNMINNVAHVLDGTAEPACSLIEAHKTSNLVEEIILVSNIVAPERTQAALRKLHEWARMHHQKFVAAILAVVGLSLLARGMGGL